MVTVRRKGVLILVVAILVAAAAVFALLTYWVEGEPLSDGEAGLSERGARGRGVMTAGAGTRVCVWAAERPDTAFRTG